MAGFQKRSYKTKAFLEITGAGYLNGARSRLALWKPAASTKFTLLAVSSRLGLLDQNDGCCAKHDVDEMRSKLFFRGLVAVLSFPEPQHYWPKADAR